MTTKKSQIYRHHRRLVRTSPYCTNYFLQLGLQIAVVDLDQRITAREGNTDGSGQNGNVFKLKSVNVGFEC